MPRIIGIDLGTTNSCVAILEQGQEVLIIPNSEGSRTTPSVVGFSDTGEQLVGQIAKRQAIANPESTIYGVKRLIGRRFDAEEVTRARETLAYRITESKSGAAWVEVGERTMSPSEVSAIILRAMKGTAEDYLGEEVFDAVITVPAYFDDNQRQATKDAGQIAGLNVLRIINEPTAAALAYGLSNKKQGKVAVYDLGGGTFDISILEIGEGVYDVLSTSGDSYLGGEDFDHCIITYLLEAFEEEHGIDIRENRIALQRVREAAEKAKHELSSTTETEINLPFLMADQTGPKHLSTALKRQELERLAVDLVEKTMAPCSVALSDAGLTTADIDEIILVGGMTRMPLVQERVAEFFGKHPHKGVNPDEVVAGGAAIQAGVLGGEVEEVLLLDVTPLSLGIETMGGEFTPLIAKNTTVPTEASEIFTTTVDNQDMVIVHVLQGERAMAADNTSLAKFELTGIPPASRGVPKIEVRFIIDVNGIVKVNAKDLASGREHEVRVTASSGLSEDEISQVILDAEEQREMDERLRKLVDQRNKIASLLYSTEKMFNEYSNTLPEDTRTQVGEDIEACRAILNSDSLDDLHEINVRLEATAHKMSELIYDKLMSESNVES